MSSEQLTTRWDVFPQRDLKAETRDLLIAARDLSQYQPPNGLIDASDECLPKTLQLKNSEVTVAYRSPRGLDKIRRGRRLGELDITITEPDSNEFFTITQKRTPQASEIDRAWRYLNTHSAANSAKWKARLASATGEMESDDENNNKRCTTMALLETRMFFIKESPPARDIISSPGIDALMGSSSRSWSTNTATVESGDILLGIHGVADPHDPYPYAFLQWFQGTQDNTETVRLTYNLENGKSDEGQSSYESGSIDIRIVRDEDGNIRNLRTKRNIDLDKVVEFLENFVRVYENIQAPSQK